MLFNSFYPMSTYTKFIKPILRKLRAFSFSNKQKNLYRLSKKSHGELNVVYILPVFRGHKAGGDKVIYKQSELINTLGYEGITSQILHPDNCKFKHSWFEHNAQFRSSRALCPQTDFVIIPEVMVIPHAKMLQSLGIRYGIYVQNGYSASFPLYVGDSDELKNGYDGAEVILTISEDTSECIQLAFPSVASNIQRVFLSVDGDKFKSKINKENIITYMPRKLANHSNLIKFFLNNNLPQGWRLVPIDGLNEIGVAEILSRSKIFLSFSELEGLGLPPIEAALSGNIVVGYTGEGAREYWTPPLFNLVHSGEVKAFTNQILEVIKNVETDYYDLDVLNQIKQNLANKYSLASEQASLKRVLDRIMHRPI
jgi:hypothetical protein